MRSSTRKRKPVTSNELKEHALKTTIAIVVAGLLAWISGWIPQIWSATCWVFTALWSHISWFGSTTTIPIWGLLGSALVISIVSFLITRQLYKPQEANEFDEHQYCWDVFDKIRWRWCYNTIGGVCDLTPFCCVCDLRLSRTSTGNHEDMLLCEDCRKVVRLTSTYYDLQSIVSRRIERNLRDGSWLKIVQEQNKHNPQRLTGT
jgi:hypothetical protein